MDKGSFFIPDSPADPYVTFSFPGYTYSYKDSDGATVKASSFTTPVLLNSESGTKAFKFVINNLFAKGTGPYYSAVLKWTYLDDDTVSADTICDEQSLTFNFSTVGKTHEYVPSTASCANGSIQFGKFFFTNFVEYSP